MCFTYVPAYFKFDWRISAFPWLKYCSQIEAGGNWGFRCVCHCRGCCEAAFPAAPSCALVFIWISAEPLYFANSAGSCLLFFFFLSGYFSASLAHWNRLAVGSERHWDQHKKGQKHRGCQKGVIAFIRLPLGFSAWKNSRVVHEYAEIRVEDFGMWFVSQVANFPALWNENKKTVQCPRALPGWSRRILQIPNPMGWPHARKCNTLASIWFNRVLLLSWESVFWLFEAGKPHSPLEKKKNRIYPCRSPKVNSWGLWELVLDKKKQYSGLHY